jgi:L-alanine-DL-glutamate epimerase-like enolase superfamily enzyme
MSSNVKSTAAEIACRVVDAEVSFRARRLVQPLVLSTGSIVAVTEAQAAVTIETCSGLRATGRGCIYLSDLWAWPDPAVPHETRVQVLVELTERIATELPKFAGAQFVHPLQFGLELHEWTTHQPAQFNIPALAQAMCGSPFDAAVHDAMGIALGRSAMDIYDQDLAIPAADSYFPSGGAIAAIRRLLQPWRRELTAWWIVNKTDPLPAALADPWRRYGHHSFKLKITGRDNAADVDRTVEVYRASRELGIAEPSLTIDSNEANPDADSVLDYLDRLERADLSAYGALAYIEQPTARDIVQSPFDWRAVAAHKPVLLDEGLTDLSVLPIAREQGWSGLALKTCKGHSILLVTAAWAHAHGMLLSLQDLTNPGISMIHGAIVGARLPTINGAELNSPQFTPEANAELLPQLRDLVEPQGGLHHLPAAAPIGLGSQLATTVR